MNINITALLKEREMPHLVHGYMRFLEEDFLLHDYQANVLEKHETKSYPQLADLLKTESSQLALMKEPEITERFNTEQNIKLFLMQSLDLITALAQKEGYKLTDLMRT
jgi:hypothetical protein